MRAMRTISLILLIASLTSTVQAASPQEIPQPSTSVSQAPLERNGVGGVWFRADAAERILADLKTARLSSELEDLYSEKIGLLEEELDSMERLLNLAEEAEGRASDALNQAIQSRIDVEAQRDAWYRAPALWFGLGVVVAGLAVGVGAYAASQ